MPSMILTSSAAAISFLSQVCAFGSISEARRGRATTSNSCCSVARFEQTAVALDQERRDSWHRLLFKRRADQDVRVDDNPHPAGGSTFFCACLMSRSISSSLKPAATTRARDARRPGISSSGSIRPGWPTSWPDRRSSRPQYRPATAVELAAALGTAKSGSLIVAAIASVFTIGYVANLLGEDEDWLHELSIDMFPEDGRLWVYGVGEDGVTAFTEHGI